jgi:hypothetical protein
LCFYGAGPWFLQAAPRRFNGLCSGLAQGV